VIKLLIKPLAIIRAQEKINQITGLLKPRETILDIGPGNGSVSHLLKQKGFNVEPIDVVDLSLYSDIKPKLYDGHRLPYANDKYAVALLLTVLHHTQKPEQVLLEATRVAKKVIIIEEIYNNYLQKLATFVIDSIFNLEFIGHPHSNKTDQQWKKCFRENNLRLLSSSYSFSLWFLKRVTYVISKDQAL